MEVLKTSADFYELVKKLRSWGDDTPDEVKNGN